jgi:Flp pilus assembly protein TadG
LRRPAGQTLVEFALILPFLLIVTLGLIEAGRLMLIYSLTSAAAREATRHGTAVDNNNSGVRYYLDCTGMEKAARDTAGVLVQLDAVLIQYDNGQDLIPNSGATCSTMSDDDLDDGDRIRVTVTATYQPLVPLVNVPPLSLRFISARTLIKAITSFAECSDGVDNDFDGLTDYPADKNCANIDDNTEAPPPGTPVCWQLFGPSLDPSSPANPGTATITNVGSPGVCDPGYGGGYLDGTDVTLQATALGAYVFQNWTIVGSVSGSSTSTDSTLVVTMIESKTITAHFFQCY